jgi:hypothetical protein
MNFICCICEKVFNREGHLKRHMNRKTPCYKNLICIRCGKKFTQVSDLNRHINKKFPCDDKRTLLELTVKLEEVKLKQKEADIKIEQEKTKQATLTYSQTAGRDIINGDNITNFNINIYPMNWSQAYDNNIEGDLLQTLLKYFVHQYNNPDFPEDQCLSLHKGKVYANQDGKLVNFNKLRPQLIKKIKDQVNQVLDNFEPLSNEYRNQHGCNQKPQLLNNKKIQVAKKLHPFVSSVRNTGVVKKQLKYAVE